MSCNYFRNFAVSAALAGGIVLSAYIGIAEDDIAARKVLLDTPSRMDAIEAINTNRMGRIEKDYANKFAPYSAESIARHKKEADLKEARMNYRDKMDDILLEKKADLSKSEYERLNTYVIQTKARREYFEEKERQKNGN